MGSSFLGLTLASVSFTEASSPELTVDDSCVFAEVMDFVSESISKTGVSVKTSLVLGSVLAVVSLLDSCL